MDLISDITGKLLLTILDLVLNEKLQGNLNSLFLILNFSIEKKKCFYFISSLVERQEILKAQYHFSCDCISCNRQDLVLFQERFSALRCHHCGGPIQNPSSEAALAHSMPCLDCGKIQVLIVYIIPIFLLKY